MKEMNSLISVMETLRSENGCNWDKKQTHESLIPYILEESYEVIDAIQKKDKDHLKEELGDVLFQVVFHSQIAKEENLFRFEDVAEAVAEKLIRRHPHVFGESKDLSPEQVEANWQVLKAKEKAEIKKGLLSEIKDSYGGFLKAEKIQKKAAEVGFDWTDVQDVIDKVEEELKEISAEITAAEKNEKKIEEELGDLLFAVVNLSRFIKVNPEKALLSACDKFRRRFEFIEMKAEESDQKLENMSLSEMEELWQKAKKNV